MDELFDFSGSSVLYEDVMRDALDSRVLIFNSKIDSDVVEDYIYHILVWNQEDNGLAPEKRKKIYFLFNSPGGDAIISMVLCDIINASATPIIGVGLGIVCSAAFYTYICCHKRIAFENTVFLRHDGDLCVANSSSKAKDTMAFLSTMDVRVKEHVLKYTSMSEEFYDNTYETEFYMYADAAVEIDACDKIITSLDEIWEV